MPNSNWYNNIFEKIFHQIRIRKGENKDYLGKNIEDLWKSLQYTPDNSTYF